MDSLESTVVLMVNAEASSSPLPEEFVNDKNTKYQVDTAFFMIYDEYMDVVGKLTRQCEINKNLRSNLIKKVILLKRYAEILSKLPNYEYQNNKRNNSSRASEKSSDSDDDRTTVVDEDCSMLNAADKYIKWKWADMENELLNLKRIHYFEKYRLMNIIKDKDFEILKLKNSLKKTSHEFQQKFE